MQYIQRISECVGIYENQSGVQFLALLEPNQNPLNPPQMLFAIQILGRKTQLDAGRP
jgi:hypothetical protein